VLFAFLVQPGIFLSQLSIDSDAEQKDDSHRRAALAAAAAANAASIVHRPIDLHAPAACQPLLLSCVHLFHILR